MRVFITGGQGRIGSVLSSILAQRGSTDACYFSLPKSASTNPAEFRSGLTDMQTAVADFRPDAILHLAALPPHACTADPGRANAVNVELTAALARVALESGASNFVFFSTSGVYGDQYRVPVAEDGTINPGSPYAESKYRAELALGEIASQAFSVTVLRIFNAYGPGLSDSLINKLVRSDPINPVSVVRGADFVRDYVHVADVVDSALRALRVGVAGCTTLNVGSGVPTSNSELIELLSEGRQISYRLIDGNPSYSCASTAQLEKVLGFRPRSLRSHLAAAGSRDMQE